MVSLKGYHTVYIFRASTTFYDEIRTKRYSMPNSFLLLFRFIELLTLCRKKA